MDEVKLVGMETRLNYLENKVESYERIFKQITEGFISAENVFKNHKIILSILEKQILDILLMLGLLPKKYENHSTTN